MFNHENRQIQFHPAGREHEVGNHGKHIYHRVHRGHGGKTESANCSGDSRNNSLTQCIIFISFMNFMVKQAVLCVLSGLCGENMDLFYVLILVTNKQLRRRYHG